MEYFATGGRSDGPLLDPNAAGALINLFLLPLLIVFWCQPSNNRRAFIFFAIITFFAAALFATFSRGAIGSFAAFTILAVAGFIVLRLPRNRTSMLASALAIVMGYGLVSLGPDPTFEHLIKDVQQDNSVQFRFLMWESTWELYLRYPILGNGLGTYKLLYPSVRSLEETGTSGDLAHNDYLQLLAEGGPALLAMYLIFGLWVLVSLWKLVRPLRGGTQMPEDRNARMEAAAFAVAILAVMSHALVNFIFYIAPISVLLGVYGGRIAAVRSSATKPVEAVMRRPRGSILLAFGGLFLYLSLLLGTSVASAYWFDPDRLTQSDYKVGSTRHQRALAISYLNPIDHLSRRYLAQAEAYGALSMHDSPMGAGMAHMALKDIQRLFDTMAVDCAGRTLQATLIYVFGDQIQDAPGGSADPEALLRQAIANTPTCLSPYLMLADIQEKDGRLNEAILTLNDAMDWFQIPGVKKSARLMLTLKLSQLYRIAGRNQDARLSALFILANDPNNVGAQEVLRQIAEGE